MAMRLNPYLSFRENAREAMTFYQSVFGGELTVNTFSEFEMSQGPTDRDMVMHSMLETPDGFVLMGSDTPEGMEFQKQAGVAISLSGDDEERLQRFWDQLTDGGTVTLPFEKAPWGDRFGMCEDRFGTGWMFNSGG